MDELYCTYCRLCAEPKQADQLCDIQENFHKIALKLNRINAISNFVEGALPKTICFKCMSALNEAFQFVIAVEKAQILLEHKVNEGQVKAECGSDNETCSDVRVDVKSEMVVDIKQESYHSDEQPNCDTEFVAAEPTTTKPNKEKPSKIQRAKKQNKKLTVKLKHKSDHKSEKQKSTWKDYPWTCSDCGTVFPSQCELTEHSMQVHNICNPYRCTDCNMRKGNLNKFMKHVRQHRKFLRFSCYKCFKEFSGPHKTYKHKCYGGTDHVCKGCNGTFQTEEDLSKHFSVFFRDLRISQPNASTDLDKVDLDNMSCKICDKVCRSRWFLFDHVSRHSERTSSHICETCGKSFYNIYSLRNHVIAHTDARPFECDVCKQRFKTRSQIINHVKGHDSFKQYACEQCGRRFKLKQQLNSHSIIHTDLMPHVCSYCNKAFRFKNLMIQHVRLHTGVKPYSCDPCGRDFTNWSNYNKHMKRRHNMNMSKRKPTEVLPNSKLVTT
ncbi:unnamed protein product [Chilo suppressalis]|uniref:Uncharacterized protein n=1 Tax=Chilo suppressalis TaxID=168631 RepID=A0ABN8B517_CHISP|nr:unnamed protein product [Chilo suppressalis]